MKKLKSLLEQAKESSSYRWAKTALFALLAFKILEFAFGTWLVLLVFIAAAAIVPVFAERLRKDQMMRERILALTSLKNLEEQAKRDRAWSIRGEPFDESKAYRFAYAQERAVQIHRLLHLRVRHLDRRREEGRAPHPGAGWNEIQSIALRVIDLLDSAQWYCSGGLSVSPGLLDPEWKLEAIIHDTSSLDDEAELEAQEHEETCRRVVVSIDEYSGRRKHRLRPHGEAQLFVLGEEQKSNDSR